MSPCVPYAPVLLRAYIFIAVNFPSFLAPIFTVTFIGWRVLEETNSSSLVKQALAGLPVLKVTKAHTSSKMISCLLPKPPPILGFITLICDIGMPKTCATILLTWYGTCVDDLITILPFSSRYEMVTCVSMGQCWVYWVVNVCSTTTSASLNPFSTSPAFTSIFETRFLFAS